MPYANEWESRSDTTIPVLILKPGGLYVRTTPTIIKTVLGSCLAITMFAPDRRIAVISHPMLPRPPVREPYMFTPLANRKYVNTVIPTMLRKMQQHQVDPGDIEIKIFGGAEIMNQGLQRVTTSHPVGSANVETARELIQAENLALKTSDVGGNTGRKIVFYTHTGQVMVKRLRSTRGRSLAEIEEEDLV